MTKIMFFETSIAIRVHTATEARWIGRTPTIQEFARSKPCRLYLKDNGDYLCEIVELNRFGRWEEIGFIEGAEVVN